MSREKKILIVGGHLAPALAVIEELEKRYSAKNIYWVGRKLAMEGETAPSLEYEVIPKMGIPFFNLETGRLQRRLTKYTIPSLFKIFKGFVGAFRILINVGPSVVLSFGGYLSFPVTFCAFFLGIPVVIHEQTTVSGLANRLAARFARKVAISYPTSALDFPEKKVVVTGNPVRAGVFAIKRKLSRPPMVYITGGGQGSQVINRIVEKILPALLGKYKIIHQTGFLDYKKFMSKAEKLSVAKGRYKIFPIISPHEVAKIYSKASLVVSRSGANTVSEIAAAGVPAIFVPIPWAEKDEQVRNAQLLTATGMVKILPQNRATPEALLSLADDFIANPPSVFAISRAKKLVDKDAAKKIVNLVESFI